MGGCCSWCLGKDDDGVDERAFQSSGRRLGSAGDENAYGSGAAPAAMRKREDDLPQPVVDPNLDDAERAQIRAERAAAAEARAKKLAGGGKKKKPDPNAQPLRGPNSQPTMTWTVGS